MVKASKTKLWTKVKVRGVVDIYQHSPHPSLRRRTYNLNRRSTWSLTPLVHPDSHKDLEDATKFIEKHRIVPIGAHVLHGLESAEDMMKRGNHCSKDVIKVVYTDKLPRLWGDSKRFIKYVAFIIQHSHAECIDMNASYQHVAGMR